MVDLRRDLHELELKEVEETNEEIGRGSYGKVTIVYYKGLKCAGKSLFRELTESAQAEGSVRLADRFKDECIHMSKARHPNLVLFLGVYFQENEEYPILIMEHLPMCLDTCLSTYPNLPPYVKNNILLDVAKGLHYLHGMNLIHRDLTAKNVLIGHNLRAKIADLGVAMIISADITGQFQKFSQVPGNAQYMPPEAFKRKADDEVVYDHKLDIFSYGNLVINTITRKWPEPAGTAFMQSEIERRSEDLRRMGEDHPLRRLTENCLNDDPAKRPSIVDIITELGRVIADNPAPFRNTMELLMDYCRCLEENKRFQVQVGELTRKIESLEQIGNKLRDDHEGGAKQISVQEKEILDLKHLLETKEKEIEIKENMLERKEDKISVLGMRIAALSQGNPGQGNLFDPTVTFSCDKFRAELPHKRKHAQAVTLNGKVYIGSGYCENDDLSHEISAFNLRSSEWEQLPVSDTRWFAMTVYQNDLILVSGKYRNGEPCKQVFKHDAEGRTWALCDDIMVMKEARMGASATSISSHLLVAGGWDKTRNRVNTVEVYDKHKRQWFKAEPLPKLAAECKTALIDSDLWFFMGGANQEKAVFYASLQAIIKRAVPMIVDMPADEHHDDPAAEEGGEGEESQHPNVTQRPDETEPLWKSLPDAPNEFSSAGVLGGTLISIGGTGFFRNSKSVFAYSPHTKSWLKIGETPEETCRAVVVPVSETSIFLVGGVDRSKRLLSSIYECTLR